VVRVAVLCSVLVDAVFLSFLVFTMSQSVPMSPIPCQPTGRSNPKPTNARRLKPDDIDIVMAMGDSIMTGALATGLNIFDPDNRAYSFGGGYSGYPDVNTLPTSLKKFNPALTGYAIGDGDAYSPNAKLNVAVDGAISENLGPQVTHLLNKLESYPSDDWKHLTIFIGGNDLCDSCNNLSKFSPARYQANLEAVLDRIKAYIPKIFISLVTPPDVTLLTLVQTNFRCIPFNPFTCACKTKAGTKDLQRLYSKVLHDLEVLPKYNDKEDFFLSIQPFMEDIEIPLLPDRTPDMQYWAIDCFHFSSVAHSAAVQALWNNLMEPRDKKARTWVIGEPWICPSPDQYLQ